MKGSTHAHPYAVPRPRAPPLEAALGREAVDDEGAAPRGAVRLAVDEALLGEHAAAAVAKADRPNNREACEFVPHRSSIKNINRHVSQYS